MAWDVHGRAALVTGAARGIGADAARRLARAGVNVALVDVDAEALASVADAVGPRALAIPADVTDQAAVDHAVAATVERFGHVDAVVANAAVAEAGPVAGGELAHLERTLETNVIGVARTIAAALPHLHERGGYVLVVASVAAGVRLPLMGAYAASKAAVEAYADTLRIELAGSAVDVGIAYFGFVDTPMLRDALSSPLAARVADRSRLLFWRILDAGVAGAAVCDAVAGRRRRVVRPRWLWPALLGSRLVQPAVDVYGARRGVPRLVRDDIDRREGSR